MADINKFSDIRDKNFVANLLKEQIDKSWLKDLLLEKKGPITSREINASEYIEIYIWDNLSKEQKHKLIESINLLIEEDILMDKQPEGNYCFDLLDLAIKLEKIIPGSINSKPFLIWREKDYFNLPQPIDHSHSVIKNLDQKIENAFGKNKL